MNDFPPPLPLIASGRPLLSMHRAGYLDLLREVYGGLTVPEAAARQLRLIHGKGLNAPDLAALPWIEVAPDADLLPMPPPWDQPGQISPIELQTLSFAMARPGHLVLVEGRRARSAGTTLGLRVTGVVGVILMAHRRGVMREVTPVLDALRRAGLPLSERSRRQALAFAGER